jgi:hypothetical protein
MTGAKKIVVFVAMLLLSGCGGPKIIPDRELAKIFHDIYLVNAYVGHENLNIDSLNIYEPVFASYGYTSEDIQYTIGNFAKRKSARLSEDVVQVAGRMLLAESNHYIRRREIRDSLRLVAREKYAEDVHFDSLIRVRRIADTSRLRITISDVRPGSYNLSMNYTIDSLDGNSQHRLNTWFVDADGKESNTSSQRLTKGRPWKATANMTSTDEYRDLVVVLNAYPKGLSTPNMTIDSLRVTYYLPDEIAVKKFVRSWYGDSLSIFDSLITIPHEYSKTNFIAPPIDTTRTRIRQGGRRL